MTSVYGDFVTATDIEELILANLRLWLPSYLGEVGAHAGKARADLPGIKTWGAPQGDLNTRPENTFPHLAVVSPGTDSAPTVDGEGTYRASWQLEVTVIANATGFAATDRLSKAYAAAVTLAMVQQHPGTPVERISWLGDTYDDLPSNPDSDRSLVAATSRFSVIVSGVMNREAGPLEPAAPRRDPSPDAPTIQTVVPPVVTRS